MVFASLTSRQSLGNFSETRERIDPPHEEKDQIPRSQAVTVSNLYAALARKIPLEVDPGRQDFRLLGLRAHVHGVVSKSLVNGEHERRPAHVRLLDDPRRTSEDGLGDQAMELVDEVVDERDPCTLGLPNSFEGIQ